MDSGTLANLMPAACMKISGGTDTGTIRYDMPADEFAGREHLLYYGKMADRKQQREMVSL